MKMDSERWVLRRMICSHILQGEVLFSCFSGFNKCTPNCLYLFAGNLEYGIDGRAGNQYLGREVLEWMFHAKYLLFLVSILIT